MSNFFIIFSFLSEAILFVFYLIDFASAHISNFWHAMTKLILRILLTFQANTVLFFFSNLVNSSHSFFISFVETKVNYSSASPVWTFTNSTTYGFNALLMFVILVNFEFSLLSCLIIFPITHRLLTWVSTWTLLILLFTPVHVSKLDIWHPCSWSISMF